MGINSRNHEPRLLLLFSGIQSLRSFKARDHADGGLQFDHRIIASGARNLRREAMNTWLIAAGIFNIGSFFMLLFIGSESKSPITPWDLLRIVSPLLVGAFCIASACQ